MSNNYYLGQTPEEFNNQVQRYFYGVSKSADGFLVLSKINMDTSVESIQLEDLTQIGSLSQTFDNFEEGIDFFEGVDPTTRMPNYPGLNYEQYKWSSDDLYYYVDSDGVLTVRIDVPYNYSEGATTYELPEVILVGSSVVLGTITGSNNPMENRTIVDLSLINDTEGTIIALDMGTIV